MLALLNATGVAILKVTSATLQISGGALLGVILGQEVGGGVTLDPSLAAAYGAIGALFGLLSWLVKGRIDRCDNREDKLLDADKEKTDAIRKLGEAVTASAAVTGNAVTAATTAVDESKRNGAKIDTLIMAINTMQSEVTANSNKIDYLLPDEPPRRKL